MYYFKKNDKMVEKYLVKYDEQDLKEIKKEINLNLSDHITKEDKDLDVNYETIKPHHLYNIINEFLMDESVTLLDEVFNDEIMARDGRVKHDMLKKVKLMDTIQEIELKKHLLTEMAQLGRELQNIRKEKPYYDKLKEVIQFELVDAMDLSTIVDVLSFMNDDKHKYIFKMVNDNTNNKTR